MWFYSVLSAKEAGELQAPHHTPLGCDNRRRNSAHVGYLPKAGVRHRVLLHVIDDGLSVVL
jgi:hypothetical protein